MNKVSDEKIMERVNQHYKEALGYFPKERIVGIFLNGSQNYGLADENSDIDTKLIVVPSVMEFFFNKEPTSHTHERDNGEHIDFKDIRLYMQSFRKQNLNFLEILFTKYKYINPIYEKEFNRLIENREKIARFNEYRAIDSMVGVSLNRFHVLKRSFENTDEDFNYKALHHIIRVEEYLQKYIEGKSYEECLVPNNPDFLLDVKRGNSILTPDDGFCMAEKAIKHIKLLEEEYKTTHEKKEDQEVSDLLDSVQGEIMFDYTYNYGKALKTNL